MRIRERHVLCGGQMATAMCACASLGLRAEARRRHRHRRQRPPDPRASCEQPRRRHQRIVIIRDVENQFAVILVDENTGDRIVLWDRDDRLRLRESELPVDALATAARRARGRRGRRGGDPGGAARARRRRDGDERHRSPHADRTEELVGDGHACRSSRSTCRRTLTGINDAERGAAHAAQDARQRAGA